MRADRQLQGQADEAVRGSLQEPSEPWLTDPDAGFVVATVDVLCGDRRPSDHRRGGDSRARLAGPPRTDQSRECPRRYGQPVYNLRAAARLATSGDDRPADGDRLRRDPATDCRVRAASEEAPSEAVPGYDHAPERTPQGVTQPRGFNLTSWQCQPAKYHRPRESRVLGRPHSLTTAEINATCQS